MGKLGKNEAIEKLKRAKNYVSALDRVPRFSPEYKKWARDTDVAIEYIFGEKSRHSKEFRGISYGPFAITANTPDSVFDQTFKKGLEQAEVILESMIQEVEEYWSDEHQVVPGLPERTESGGNLTRVVPCIFVGHGQSKLWARLKIFLEDDLALKTITYESESRVGESIVPILEKMLNQVDFAVLVLTAEDETAVGAKRARQNVVHEAGLFQGKLGFKRAVILRQEGLEDFSNVAGLQYIPFTDDKIEQTFYELQRVLKREGVMTQVG
jgi:Predicted nucleotide-binding protein containing TIR-like domain